MPRIECPSKKEEKKIRLSCNGQIKVLFGLYFSGLFCRKITVAIWYMWSKKMIEKYVQEKRSNFSLKICNPNTP